MCGCITEHPGFSCGSDACHCHGNRVHKRIIDDDILRFESDKVYLNITFSDISRPMAAHILETVTNAIGLTSYSVFISDAEEDDEE